MAFLVNIFAFPSTLSVLLRDFRFAGMSVSAKSLPIFRLDQAVHFRVALPNACLPCITVQTQVHCTLLLS